MATTTTAALSGKVALVTGGSRGIGEAIAVRLAADGADVVLTYRDGAELAAGVVKRIEDLDRRALAVRVDAADPAQVREVVARAVEAYGRLDILVNNAGVGAIGPIGEFAVSDVDRVLDVNVRGPFLAAQAAAEHVADGGRIVNIGSCMVDRAAFAGGTLYATSKAALVGLTRALARELGPRSVTVNVVHAGPTDTDMNPADGPSADFQRGFTALGRYAWPDEIAATVAHLAGPSGAYITGAAIPVDGGYAA